MTSVNGLTHCFPDCLHDDLLKLVSQCGPSLRAEECVCVLTEPLVLYQEELSNSLKVCSCWAHCTDIQRCCGSLVAADPMRYHVCLSAPKRSWCGHYSPFFGAMITFFPMGACGRTIEPSKPWPLWPPPLLFTLLLRQHQMVMDSHMNSMESVFSTRQCLWGLQWRLMLWCLPSYYVYWQARTTVTPGRE